MKKLLRKIVFGDIPVSEYSTVTVPEQVIEQVLLTSGTRRIEVSTQQWLLCLDPVIFGIWLTNRDDIAFFDKRPAYKLHFNDAAKAPATVSVVSLTFFNKINEEDGTLLLLKLENVKERHLSLVKTLLLYYKHYKKPEQDFYKLKGFAAAYSYPRKVRLVSFKEGNDFTIFPMDLVGEMRENNRYVFGLRHTNITLPKIIATKKMAISEIPYSYKDIIYKLGKHHRGPVDPTTNTMKFIETEQYQFPIPAWANSYKEIRIVKTMNLGSHMLLWGEVINQKSLSDPTGHLFHIHFLHYLHQKKRGLAYPLV